MKVYTMINIEINGKEVPTNSVIEVPKSVLPTLSGKVAYIANGELRVPLNCENLELLIVELTSDDFNRQRKLLELHCEAFDRHHIFKLWRDWGKKVETLEHEKGLSKVDAEQDAAKELHLLAFLEKKGA